MFLEEERGMSESFNIRIANKVVGITPCYDLIKTMCKEYLTDLACDFQVQVSEMDIQYEKERALQESIISKKEIEYSDSYLEINAIYRKIALKMLEYNTLLFHGSAIAVDGEAYLFTAKSGVGKSTHTRLWRDFFKDRAVMVNDDKPLLRFTEDEIFVCGTPWDGKHRLSTNIEVPLKAIAIMDRDSTNHIEKIDKKAALPMLFQQSFHPQDKDNLAKVLCLITRLADNTELYQLGCNMQPDAVEVAYYGMKG